MVLNFVRTIDCLPFTVCIDLCGALGANQSVTLYWRWKTFIAPVRNAELVETSAWAWVDRCGEELPKRPHQQIYFSNMSSSGIAVGLNKGFPVTKRVVGARPSNKKAVSTA